MRHACPACGGYMNPHLRQGDTFGVQSEERNRKPNFLYECLDCGNHSIWPAKVHEDRIEWFFDVFAYKILMCVAVLIVLAFVAQVLGILH